jgi:hypothetical protein
MAMINVAARVIFIFHYHSFVTVWRAKRQNAFRVKRYWEIIADNLSNAGWSLGWVSAIDSGGRTIWIADAHRDDGKRFIVRADEKLSALVYQPLPCCKAEKKDRRRPSRRRKMHGSLSFPCFRAR